MVRDKDTQGTVRISAADRATVRKRLADLDAPATVADTGAPAAGGEVTLARGHEVGEYLVEEVLGRGGFGTVYRAIQPVIGKRVAIKVLSRKFSVDREIVSRFVAEARAVNQIRHRHIIDIFSFGALRDGRQYYVMEYLEGEPLDRYLARHGRLGLDEALPILRAVARALDAAHAKGIAHRDLKPENVFLARDDEGALFPKLLDFGIAKLSGEDVRHAHRTNTGVPIGTPYYMSPEQCRGRDVDHRTDLYSFGVLAYRLLTGAYPFDGALVDIMYKQVYEEARPPSSRNPALGVPVDAAVSWMMRKDPSQRPISAVQAVVALGDTTAPTPVTPPPTTRVSIPAVRRPRRPRWIVPLTAAVTIAAGLITYVIVDHRRSEVPFPALPALVRPEPAPPPAPPPAATPAPPRHVTLTIAGVPDGTEVLVAGAVVGAAPGPVQLERAATPIVLTFRADGHVAASRAIVPAEDQRLELRLARRPPPPAPRVAPRPRPPQPDPGDDDVIHVFGQEKP